MENEYRIFFAALAMNGLMHRYRERVEGNSLHMKDIVRISYEMADAMMEGEEIGIVAIKRATNV